MSSRHQNSPRRPISIREWLVCILASSTLVFSAWSLGGYKIWALHLLFSGGLGTFLASVIPMPRRWNGYDQQHGNLKNVQRLLLQPFFWAGMCFLTYILIQYLNPSVVQVFGEKSWWVEAMRPPMGNKLPSSVKAPYEEMNALRTFVIHASAISLACGILVGIQRSKPALIILWSFVSSGATMGFVAILQKLSGTNKILWFVNVLNDNPWGTFAYRNQGVAFLILVLLIAGLLYFFYFKCPQMKLKQNGPHYLCFSVIFLLHGSIWLALSRGGILIGSILAILFYLLVIFHNIRGLLRGGNWIKSAFFILMFAFGSFVIMQLTNWEEFGSRLKHLEIATQSIDSNERFLSSKATWEMSQERLVYGWGAGSFRYIFPIFQKEYEQLSHFYDHKNRPYGRKIYNYAHNDLIQFFAEYGIIGIVLMIFLVFCLMVYLGIIIKVSLSAACLLFVGVSLIFAHNFIDFIFSSPAYWVAFFGSLLLIGKLYYLEFKAEEANFKNGKITHSPKFFIGK
mgnify:CR=1 FL=1